MMIVAGLIHAQPALFLGLDNRLILLHARSSPGNTSIPFMHVNRLFF